MQHWNNHFFVKIKWVNNKSYRASFGRSYRYSASVRSTTDAPTDTLHQYGILRTLLPMLCISTDAPTDTLHQYGRSCRYSASVWTLLPILCISTDAPTDTLHQYGRSYRYSASVRNRYCAACMHGSEHDTQRQRTQF